MSVRWKAGALVTLGRWRLVAGAAVQTLSWSGCGPDVGSVGPVQSEGATAERPPEPFGGRLVDYGLNLAPRSRTRLPGGQVDMPIDKRRLPVRAIDTLYLAKPVERAWDQRRRLMRGGRCISRLRCARLGE